MAYDNLRQIAKYTTKNTVIDFVDNMKINSFEGKNSQRKSNIHETYSRVKLTIVDWSKGKKENAVVCQYNLEPEILKSIAILIISNKIDFFGYTDSQQKRPLFTKYKVNHYSKNPETGLSPVSRLDITYETGLRIGPKWKITIENGEAPAIIGEEGQVTYNTSKYKTLRKSSVFISPFDAVVLMTQLYGYIDKFEMINFNTMIKTRNKLLEQELLGKKSNTLFF